MRSAKALAALVALASHIIAAPTCSAAPSVKAAPELSLTQKLFLADTVADRYKLLPDDSNFVFDFNVPQEGRGEGGEMITANRKTFPALVGSGAAMALGRVSPCGLNTFHIHPRSAELQLVFKGKLITEMTPENGVVDKDGKRRVIRTELSPGMMTIFPQGSVHHQFNPECDQTEFVAAFASEDYGGGQVMDQSFAFGDQYIQAVLGGSIAAEDIDRVRGAIPKSILKGVDECIKRCKVKKRSVET